GARKPVDPRSVSVARPAYRLARTAPAHSLRCRSGRGLRQRVAGRRRAAPGAGGHGHWGQVDAARDALRRLIEPGRIGPAAAPRGPVAARCGGLVPGRRLAVTPSLLLQAATLARYITPRHGATRLGCIAVS